MTLPTLPYYDITYHGKAIIETLRGSSGPAKRLYYDAPLVGAEIGVWRGKNAATLLSRLPGLRLYMVDMWGEGTPVLGRDPIQGDAQMAEALAETSFAEDRRVVVRCASPAAVALIPEPLDFVFVDGDHYFDGCLADLRAWWPLVKPGGWMMGHDIDNPSTVAETAKFWGVRQAVEQFCSEAGGLTFTVSPYPAMVFAIRKEGA